MKRALGNAVSPSRDHALQRPKTRMEKLKGLVSNTPAMRKRKNFFRARATAEGDIQGRRRTRMA
jgi:hypothetical protein